MASTPTVQDAMQAAKNATALAKVVTKGFSKTSISRLSQDSIFQFSFLISADIPVDEIVTISNATERNDAAMLVSAISLRNKVDLTKYGSIQNYLKTFHNNKAAILPSFLSMINYAAESMGAEGTLDLPRRVDLKQIALECWNDDMKVNQRSLNDFYKPYTRNERVMNQALSHIREYQGAMEAFENAKSAVNDAVKNAADSNSPLGKIGSAVRNDAWKDTPKPAEGTVIRQNAKGDDVIIKSARVTANGPAIVNMQKLASLEPTMINVPFIVVDIPGKDSKAQPLQWTQNVVIGVKNMIRPLTSAVMVSNMISCVKSSNAVFGFIKWTRGEFKTSEFITGAAKSKDVAMAQGPSKYLKALRRRKLINNITKFFDKAVPPNATIIITAAEAELIRQETGVDLNEVYYSAKVLNEYYLLAFGIYDTEEKTLQVLYDGDTDWSTATIAQIKSNLSKNNEVQNAVNMIKAMNSR